MCLIILAYKAHPRFPLIVAANRDEFLARPASPAHFWSDASHILAGRDLRAGGTWLGITTSGRFAALTNYRDLRRPVVNGMSRGGLVREALDQDVLDIDPKRFDGYNLIHGPVGALRYHNNIDGTDVPLSAGIHGLSNHLLDTPWPKVVRARDAFTRAITVDEPLGDDLFALLRDPVPAPDQELPDTGLDLLRERALSSAFIATEGYGTRCSTVVMVRNDGEVRFAERTYAPQGEVRHAFQLDSAHF